MMAHDEQAPPGSGVAPDADEIRRALQILRPAGAILLVTIDPEQKLPVSGHAFVMPEEIDDAVLYAVRHNSNRLNLYWTPNATELGVNRKAAKKDMVAALYLWADCDPPMFRKGKYPEARAYLLDELMPRLTASASFIIDSGNGLQPFWRLAEPAPIDRAAALTEYEAVNAAIGVWAEGPSTFNADRVMRLPGTVNYPNATKLKKGYPAQPGMARLLAVTDAAYTLESAQAVIVRSNPLQERFERFLATCLPAKQRWNGHRADLLDQSGSAMDMSLLTLLKLNGFTLDECHEIMSPWPHGSEQGRAQGHRYWARMWDRSSAGQQAPPIEIRLPLRTRATPPTAPASHAALLTVPGVLGEFVRWYNETAPRAQPLFAVQAALAFGSVVLGRRYRTTWNNWPSLYFLAIGKTASGKEYIKSAIEKHLEAAQLDALIGTNRYASEPGVLSKLHARPAHIDIIDEFGKLLDAGQQKESRVGEITKVLMEIWGRCDGTIRPTAYATAGLSRAEILALESNVTRNPALTLVCLSTPESFYEALSSRAIRDGFLNRFLVVESAVGRQPLGEIRSVDASAAVCEWAQRMQRQDTGGNLDGLVQAPDLAPVPQVVPFTQAATACLRESEAALLTRMDELDAEGLADLLGRTQEIAMRLALIVARSCDSDVIDAEHMDWAIQYVTGHAERALAAARVHIADGAFDAARKQIGALIEAAGEKGMTAREIAKASRRWRQLAPRQQNDLLAMMANLGDIAHREVGKGANGKPRTAWVALESDE